MNEAWNKFLTDQGTVIRNVQAPTLGEADNEVYSLDHTYLCNLSNLGLIKASGEDAQNFLHGQFTNDLNLVNSKNSQLSSYCNPKGRMLSIFRIYKTVNGYHLILPKDVIEKTLNKLNMFKLIAKVELIDASDELVIFGVAGPNTESVLSSIDLTMPQKIDHCVIDNETTLIRLPSENSRVICITRPKQAITIWGELAKKLDVASNKLWNLHDIYSGIPTITENTSEAFIPQMTNLEIIKGVSFSKGCYPGQEVIARTHYLGKPNRRMYRINIITANVPEPGINIFSSKDENQPVGKVVIAEKISDEITSALAVLRIANQNDRDLHLSSVSGANISMQSLPYSLDNKTN